MTEPATSSSAPILAAGHGFTAGVRAMFWSGVSNDRIVIHQCLAMLLPLLAGLMMYGWRAAGAVATVVLTALLSGALWQHVGRRGSWLRPGQLLPLALPVALMLPAHLFARRLEMEGAGLITVWPILPAAGLTLVVCCWLMGFSHRGMAVLLTPLLISSLFGAAMEPQWVLKRSHAFLGDLLDAEPAPDEARTTGWHEYADTSDRAALRTRPSAARLTAFTTGVDRPERSWLSMEHVIRDELAPLENLFLAGEPGPIGTTSAVAVVIGGLLLIYWGLSDYRIPLLIVVGALLALLVLPVPVVVTEAGPQWRWLAFRADAARWDVAVTFANYQILGSPLLFVALFLAPAASLRPLGRSWRAVYALLAGILSAAAQLYIDAATGPCIALLLVALLTPLMDHLRRSRDPG
ncbi:MAG: RnfABCDGE type electron transport complex subunit D [Phycisphaerae bacterium]|nr:RnfABCDGE type electron transport complex subunit D [Phycisphaerae bacterium]MDW8261591.1 RnfABCDGE type electron transport complex subunit D [Phycisphaerales bacterium]